MACFSYHGKSIFYEECGQGTPLIFLHGNTASSKLFLPILALYSGRYRCICLDFLGNGRSDRVEAFPTDLWQDEGRQAIALIRHLSCGKACLAGTSGGAWAALNAALECPELVCAVVADSFDGRTLHDGFAEELAAEREAAKADAQARGFYEWCQGEDWEKVVALDTEAMTRCAREGRPLFRRPLEEIRTPVLLMGSMEDRMCRKNLEEEYRAMAARMPGASVHMMRQGGHPALLTNAAEAAEAALAFLDACRQAGDEKRDG